MRITLFALGTRGDVQPALALALGLREVGHTITFLAGEENETWVKSYGFSFHPCINIQALMSSGAGLAWVEGNHPMQQIKVMEALINRHGATINESLISAAQGADLVLSGFTTEMFAYAICEKYRIRQISATLQPYRPTSLGAASLIPIVANGKSRLNRWTGLFAARLLWKVSAKAANELRSRLGLSPISAQQAVNIQVNMPTVQGFSTYVVPHADDWNSQVYTTGYWFLNEGTDYQPPQELTDFLNAGDPPVYIGFGSMTSSDPKAQFATIIEAVKHSGVRAVVGAGWSGVSPVELPKNIHYLQKVPHDWLFPKMAAVVHHGGAGTTAATLRAGKPTLIIPHIADQPYWGRRVHELGVGMKPIPRQKLTTEALAHALRDLFSNTERQSRAAALGANLRAENGVAQAVEIISRAV